MKNDVWGADRHLMVIQSTRDLQSLPISPQPHRRLALFGTARGHDQYTVVIGRTNFEFPVAREQGARVFDTFQAGNRDREGETVAGDRHHLGHLDRLLRR